jgi:type IV pilus assembly protein PilB
VGRAAVIDLRVMADPAAWGRTRPVRKLLYMVLALAVKDRATEVRFTPGDEGCGIAYRVGGVLYDMVPAPAPLVAEITTEWMRLAKLGPMSRPLTHLRRWFARLGEDPITPPLEGDIRVVVNAYPVEGRVIIHSPDRFGRVTVRLLGREDPAASAARLLQQAMERRESVPSVGA